MSTIPAPLRPARSFDDARTCQMLHAACLEEKHTHRLYLHAARRMEEASLHVIAHALLFTAAQEKEHADVMRGLIRAHGGKAPVLASDGPLLLPREPLDLLQHIAGQEQLQHQQHYPALAQTAAEEGYPRIAEAFRRIGETERLHALRFQQYAAALADGSLFRDAGRVSWLCLPCGQFHTGQEPPDFCSSCGRDRGHFIRSSFYPFVVEG